MGVNTSCRQGVIVTSSCCCRYSSDKTAKRSQRNDAIVNKSVDQRSTGKDNVTNSPVARIPVLTEKQISVDEPDQSGFLKSLPTNTNGLPLPQTPPDIQSSDGFMNIHELYNIFNVGYTQPYIHDPYYMLILDSRNNEQFTKSHILTARKHTAIDTDFDCQINMLFRYTMIILYDENGTVDSEIMECLLTIIGTTCDVYILTEGYRKFQSVYPFLCTSGLIQSEKHRKQISTYPSVVLEGCLFQGNMKQAESKELLQAIGITHIVNVTLEMKNLFPDEFVYLRIAVEDELSSNLRPRLSQAADFIADAIRHGGRVMVHCVQGVSRSSTVTLSFMMKYLGWPLKQAHDYLKICRPIINPNRMFVKQLCDFEKEVFGEQLSDADDVWFR